MAKIESLATVSQKMISSNEEMTSFLTQLKDKTIPLFPETVNFGVRPEFKLSATLVSIDPNNSRHVYPVDGGKVALHLNKINEIAQASDLKITDSRILERSADEKTGQVIYISHQVKWQMRAIDGSLKSGVATGKYDYYNDKATKTEKQVISRRKHAEALAESNALTRAFNKAIAKLEQAFDKKELQKPFLVPCVVQDKHELLKNLDPQTAKQIEADYARKQLGLAEKIYSNNNGDGIALPAHEPEPEPEPEHIQDAEVIDASEMSPEEMNRILAEEFRDQDQVYRTNKILELVGSKGYKDPAGKAITESRIENQTLDNQISFIERLLNMEANDDQAAL